MADPFSVKSDQVLPAGQLPTGAYRVHRKSNGLISAFAILWAMYGVFFALIFSPDDWRATAGLVMVTQAFTGRLVWERFKITRAAVLPDFLSLVLFNQFVTKTLTVLGLLFRYGLDTSNSIGDTLVSLNDVPLEYQFQAELVFLTATLTFTGIWRLLERDRIFAIWLEPRTRPVWAVYGGALLVYLAMMSIGKRADFGLVTELSRLFAVGAVAVLLGGSGAYAMGKRKSLLAILGLVPLLIFALRSGMKSEVVLVLLPILLPVFRRINLSRSLLLSAFLAFVVLFVFPFSNAWRSANWSEQDRNQTYGISEVASAVAATWRENGFLGTAADSTARWLSRGSSAASGGLVMQLAESDGHIGAVLIEGLPTIFIPRFLWPDKPQYAPGAWFTWYLGWADSPETATTSTAMMLPTELYWMFGPMGVVVGMAAIAVLYFLVWRILVRQSASGRLIYLIASFAFLARAGGMEEVHTIYAVSSPIILLVYVLVLAGALRVVARSLRKELPSRVSKT